MTAATKQPQSLNLQAGPNSHRCGRNKWLRTVVVAAAAIVLFCQLLAPPIVGLADNGDFSKMIGQYGLTSPAYWEYIGVRYPLQPNFHYDPGFSSSEQVFIRIALLISRVMGKDGSLDIRLAGIVHSGLFLLAVTLFVPLVARTSRGVQLGYCAAILFVFTDVMYVSYLNSLYMDVSSLLMLLLAAVFYLRAIAWRGRSDAILFVASSVFLISSKPQHAVWGFWIAALVWVARGPLWGGRKLAASAVGALVLVTAWATARFEAPPGYSANNCFNVVFFQILPNSQDVDRTMADLGLNGNDRVWIGRTAYSPGSKMGDPAFSKVFTKRISYAKLAQFYLTHPRDGWRALRNGLAQAGRERERVGNFPISAGRPPNAESESFAWWSDLKHRLFYGHALRLLLTFLGIAGLTIFALIKQRDGLNDGVMAGAVVLIGTALTEMLIASLADALDLARHHLLFHAEFDMLVLAALWLAIQRLRGRVAEGRQ